MELQELKNNWEALDKKMEQNINLNRAILEEQLRSKAHTNMDKLFKSNLTLLIVFVVCLGILVVFYQRFHIPELVLFAAILLSLNILWTGFIIYKLNKLSEIDVTNRTRLKRAMEFEILHKYSIKIGYYITAIAILPMIYFLHSNLINVGIAVVAYGIGACIGLIIDSKSFKDVKQLRATLEEIDDM